MAHIKTINEMVNFKNNISIDLQVDDYFMAEALFDIAERIENDDLLDDLYESPKKEIFVEGEHYSAIIRKN